MLRRQSVLHASALSQAAHDWTIAPPSFVIDVAVLLLVGPHAAAMAAAIFALSRELVNRSGPFRALRAALNVVGTVVAIEAAGFVHAALGGTHAGFAWPAQVLPIAAAVITYCVVVGAAADLAAPLLAKRPLGGRLAARFLEGLSRYAIAASIAAALVTIVDRRAWEILPVALAPLALLYAAYVGFVGRLREDRRERAILDALGQGVVTLDGRGRIASWSDPLASVLDCTPAEAMGRALVDAVPGLQKTTLPSAIDQVRSGSSNGARVTVVLGAKALDVKVFAADEGLTLLVTDVTERLQTEVALRRNDERLRLAAEGANDGLWHWDRTTKEVYFSGRWMEMLGMPAAASVGVIEHWVDRVHPEDAAGFNQALEAFVTGRTERLQHEHRIRHEDGSYRRCQSRATAVRGAAGRAARVAGSLTDVTDGLVAVEQLRTAHVLDPLTGLANRAEFVERLGRRLAEFKQHPAGSRFAALYLDLDRFKVVNDSLGHLVGDELLKNVSRRLESCLRESDALARLGGDEFAILLNDLGDDNQANAVAFRIQKTLGAPFAIDGREVFTSASIGIAFGRAQYDNPDEIMRDADCAMYHAKSRGKARHELFDTDMQTRTADRIGLESDLRHAVEQNAFELHYQPIVLLRTGMCVGFESLIRWSRNGTPVPPAQFIPMAEELGLIEPVGTWCLEQACAAFAAWKRRYPASTLEYITVNVSSRQLVQHNFLSLVERVIEETGVKPCELRLEITETALMDSPGAAARLLANLRDFGVKIYLDDFGTGYSSLSHLHRLPVDALKIDRSFVNNLGVPDQPAIVESILALARTMNTGVVAEGIETPLQARELERLGCTHAQGYLFSKPLPKAKAEQVLAANEPLSPGKTRDPRANDAAFAIPA